MPYIPNTDEDQPGSAVVSPGAGGTHLSPGSGVGGTATPGATQSTPGAGGSFATLQSYLTANQGQAAPLANKITSGIGQQYNTLQGQNASTLSGIQGNVAQASTPQDTALLAQEAANPVSFASNPSNVQSFQKQLADQYTGPMTAESTPEFTKQQNAINSAIATGTAQTGTEAGREQLLSQNEARPTTGVTALNSAILTQSPDYLSNVQNAYQPFTNLLSGLNAGAAGINSQIGAAKSDAAAAQAKANKQIADQTQGLQTGLQTELTTAQNTANQTQPAFTSLMDTINQSGYSALSPTQLSSLGITPTQAKQYDAAYGLLNANAPRTYLGNLPQPVAPGSLVTAPANVTPSLATVATPDQYAMDSALAQLIGPGYTNFLNPAQANLAGTFATSGPSFNTAPAGTEVANASKVANFLAGYNPDLNTANPAQYNKYDPNYNYQTPTAAAMAEYLKQLQGYDTGPFRTNEEQAIQDIQQGLLA